jgi:hypothetical protein
MGDIGDAEELLGKEEREVRGAWLAMRLIKQSADGQTIDLPIAHPTLPLNGSKENEEYYQ